MKSSTITPIARLVVAILLLATGGCATDQPTQVANPAEPLIGTWIVLQLDGIDISSWEYSQVFTPGSMVFTGDEGCKVRAGYSVSGNLLTSTIESDDCSRDTAGSVDIASFVVSGDRLLLLHGTDTTELRKGTPRPVYVSGNWRVDSIGGIALPAGESRTLAINRRLLTVIHSGRTSCTESFRVDRDIPGTMHLTRTIDGCSGKPAGEYLLSRYTITGSRLELLIGDITWIATRM